MFRSARIPLTFLIIGICWALFSNPLITLFFRHVAQTEQDSYRSLNDLVFVILITYVLYVKIKKQQRELTKSEEEYRQLFESNPNPLWLHNQKGNFVKINNAAVDKYDYSRKKFLKMNIADIQAKDGQLYPDEENMEGIRRHTKASGETFFVSTIAYPVIFNDEPCKLVMATDITDLIEKEHKLEDAYQKLKSYNDTLVQIAWSNSHELRRPLCSVMALVSLLEDASDDERAEFLRLLKISSQELDEVVQQNNKKVTDIEPVQTI
jgi:PAS domain S-box-containing protein